MNGIVPRPLYDRPTLLVAQDLLGKYLVREIAGDRRAGKIVEVEAYAGHDDLASHARFGPGGRSAPMFGPPGHAYVYLIYGFHHMVNVVTEGEGSPGAVLIRAIEPAEGIDGPTSGPGRVCRALGIDRSLNGHDLTAPPLYIEDRGERPGQIVATPRINVDFAGEWAERPWRFVDAGSRWLSRRLRMS
jgi:DNA-3-methyladenine glycosylase